MCSYPKNNIPCSIRMLTGSLIWVYLWCIMPTRHLVDVTVAGAREVNRERVALAVTRRDGRNLKVFNQLWPKISVGIFPQRAKHRPPVCGKQNVCVCLSLYFSLTLCVCICLSIFNCFVHNYLLNKKNRTVQKVVASTQNKYTDVPKGFK